LYTRSVVDDEINSILPIITDITVHDRDKSVGKHGDNGQEKDKFN
jgi:hypothetical protein